VGTEWWKEYHSIFNNTPSSVYKPNSPATLAKLIQWHKENFNYKYGDLPSDFSSNERMKERIEDEREVV